MGNRDIGEFLDKNCSNEPAPDFKCEGLASQLTKAMEKREVTKTSNISLSDIQEAAEKIERITVHPTVKHPHLKYIGFNHPGVSNVSEEMFKAMTLGTWIEEATIIDMPLVAGSFRDSGKFRTLEEHKKISSKRGSHRSMHNQLLYRNIME